MVFLTAALGGWLATRDLAILNLLRCAEAGLYVLLVTGSASIINQVVERETDGLMERTRHRPLVTGELTVLQAQQPHSSAGAPTATYAALSKPPPPSDDHLCVVCMEQPRTHLVFPCGHKCLCKGCTTRTEGHAVCPMCRQPVQGVCEVFE